jgi:selenoprotein W-related protein
VSLAEKVLKKKKQEISGLELVPSDGGVFEVEVDGKLVFSKTKEGRFPEWAEVAGAFGLT